MSFDSRYQEACCFVLHKRLYQETSAIFQVFSEAHGIFSLIVKGLNSKRSQSRKALLQPFKPLMIQFTGKSELKTLVHCEFNQDLTNIATGQSWNSDQIACGFYLSELIVRSIPVNEAFPFLFKHYESALTHIQMNANFSQTLRNFEVALLTELGIAPDWQYDRNEALILADKYYCFLDESGFELMTESDINHRKEQSLNVPQYSGQAILDLAAGEFSPESLKDCQRLTQRLLRQVIGDRPLQSRKLWQHSRNKN